jgi:hypothetical protein
MESYAFPRLERFEGFALIHVTRAYQPAILMIHASRSGVRPDTIAKSITNVKTPREFFQTVAGLLTSDRAALFRLSFQLHPNYLASS